MLSLYGCRTIADGRIIFGVRRRRYLIGLVHWVQDFVRIGEVLTLAEFGGAGATSHTALETAFNCDDVRKIEKEQSDTISKAANPGNFKEEKKWPEWEPAFVNYLSTIPGINGIPFSYVVRENKTPIV